MTDAGTAAEPSVGSVSASGEPLGAAQPLPSAPSSPDDPEAGREPGMDDPGPDETEIDDVDTAALGVQGGD